MPSGVYKHKPAPENHPWRKIITSDVIKARSRTKIQRLKDEKELLKYLKIYA